MIENLMKSGVKEMPWEDKDGCAWRSRSAYLQIKVLGLCGCGNPDEVMQYVKNMLEKLDSEDWGSYEDLPYMFFVYWANDKGFAEHGTTVRCSVLTEKGKELLKDIRSCLKEEG